MKSTAELSTGSFVPINGKTGEECQLAMQELWLFGKILPVGARLFVRHTFRSAESVPLEVVYAFGLPRDAALRRFRVSGERFSVRSELKLVEEATEKYERGIEEGHLAVMTRQYGDGVVNLSLGNLLPGETVTVYLELVAGVESRDGGFRFRFPFSLAPTYHAKARAIEVEPGKGEIELPAEEFGDVILPTWAEESVELHRIGFDLSVSMSADLCEIASPSHPLSVISKNSKMARVRLATGGDVPNRDLVLDATTKASGPDVFAGLEKNKTGRFAAVIPSSQFGSAPKDPMRVVFVIDRSGSMSGEPMRQALKAVEACLGALSQEDTFSIVAFDDQLEVMGSKLIPGAGDAREKAKNFLANIHSRGGTELLAGLREGAKFLTGGAGDIFLLTDGQVSGTETVIREAKHQGIRVHCLGIGSASQDRFLSQLSRETGGLSRMVMPRERVDMAAVELFASVGRPVASDIRVEMFGRTKADISPAPLTMVFTGTPLLLFGSTEGAGQAEMRISWQSGGESKDLVLNVDIKEEGLAEVLRLLQGGRLITDLELQADSSESKASQRKRASRINRALETASFEYGLASRRVALVAVVEREGDRPGDVPKTTVVRVGMPQDVRFSSYFQPPASFRRQTLSVQSLGFHDIGNASFDEDDGLNGGDDYDAEDSPALYAPPMDLASERTGHFVTSDYEDDYKEETGESVEETLLELAARIKADGGLPGQDSVERIIASFIALLLYASEGHTPQRGAFAPHMRRLVLYLDGAEMTDLEQRRRLILTGVLEKIRERKSIQGDWLTPARSYLEGVKISREDFWLILDQ